MLIDLIGRFADFSSIKEVDLSDCPSQVCAALTEPIALSMMLPRQTSGSPDQRHLPRGSSL